MKAQQALFIAFAGLAAGCASSDYQIQLDQGRVLTIGSPLLLAKEDFCGVAVASDGSSIASIEAGNQMMTYQVDTGAMRSYSLTSGKGMSPLLFSRDGKDIYCFPFLRDNNQSAQMCRVSLASGEVVPLPIHIPDASHQPEKFANAYAKENVLIPRNAQWTLALLPNGVLTNEGHLVTEVPEGFDAYGNAWGKSQGRWIEVEADGQLNHSGDPTGHLVFDQTRLRGSYRLEQQNQQVQYKGAIANVSEVWIHSNRAPGAALVLAAADVYGEAFIPGHELVGIATEKGTFVVPYSVDKTVQGANHRTTAGSS